LGYHNAQAIREALFVEDGQLQVVRRAKSRDCRALRGRLALLAGCERNDFERIHAIGEPGARGVADVRYGGLAQPPQTLFVSLRSARISHARGENIGFTSEATNPLDAAHKTRV